MAKIEETIEQLIKSKIENIGYELYDVLFLKEGSNRILRVVIDNNTPITLDDCEKVNDEIKDLIDEADLINENYFFEVSSPGIERLLRKDWQLNKYIGSDIEIKLFKKDEQGNKNYIGKLINVDKNFLKIETDKQINIERKNIAQVKTVYTD